MSSKKTWAPPGWPWELELLALVFVILALVLPFYIAYTETPPTHELSLLAQSEMMRKQDVATMSDQLNFFWAVGILGLYLIFILFAFSSISMLSTPFTHLFSPLVFAMITYYRLLTFKGVGVRSHIVNGSLTEILFWAFGVFFITVLVARVRMARHMLRFRGIDWVFTTPSLLDSTLLTQLSLTVRPLFYPPHKYLVCDEGILIEGWLYVMPIPFSSIQSIENVRKAGFMTAGNYMATSTRSMVRMQLTDSSTPIFISPADRQGFMSHCNEHMRHGVVTLSRDTSIGD